MYKYALSCSKEILLPIGLVVLEGNSPSHRPRYFFTEGKRRREYKKRRAQVLAEILGHINHQYT
jgi:hypothetical protein